MHKKGSFEVDSADESNGFLLWQIATIWQQKIKQIIAVKYNLTHAQFVLLASIYWIHLHNTEITQIILANHTKMEVMQVSQLLKVLEKSGLIERCKSQKDSRSNIVELTETGEELISQAMLVVNKIDRDFFSALNEDDRKFNSLLKALLVYNEI